MPDLSDLGTGVYSLPMKFIYTTILLLISVGLSHGGRAPIDPISNTPYTGAIVVDVTTGKTLFEDGADRPVFPASIVKLMDLLIILDRVEQGTLAMTTEIQVRAEAARMGGSQVYLKEGERFSLNEMLYALCIKSANDVAVALATHIAGSKDAFVVLMNRRAEELGMTSTRFESVHGLPPETGQKPDLTTARDIAILAKKIVTVPKALEYTSTREKWFRNNTFQMLSHNRLMSSVAGCDGLKTGYYRAAGFSIAATASRHSRRVIAVVMGCSSRTERDEKARELLEFGFANLPKLPAPKAPISFPEIVNGDPQAKSKDACVADAPRSHKPKAQPLMRFLKGTKRVLVGFLIIMVVAGGIIAVLYAINRYRDRWKYKL